MIEAWIKGRKPAPALLPPAMAMRPLEPALA